MKKIIIFLMLNLIAQKEEQDFSEYLADIGAELYEENNIFNDFFIIKDSLSKEIVFILKNKSYEDKKLLMERYRAGSLVSLTDEQIINRKNNYNKIIIHNFLFKNEIEYLKKIWQKPIDRKFEIVEKLEKTAYKINNILDITNENKITLFEIKSLYNKEDFEYNKTYKEIFELLIGYTIIKYIRTIQNYTSTLRYNQELLENNLYLLNLRYNQELLENNLYLLNLKRDRDNNTEKINKEK